MDRTWGPQVDSSDQSESVLVSGPRYVAPVVVVAKAVAIAVSAGFHQQPVCEPAGGLQQRGPLQSAVDTVGTMLAIRTFIQRRFHVRSIARPSQRQSEEPAL